MRLIIVANRLPVTLEERDGKITFKPSSGGLVTGMSAWLESIKDQESEITETIWIGWPGGTVDDSEKSAVQDRLLRELRCYPVFLSEADMESFYHGFCNSTIWPLFHYFPTYTNFVDEHWHEYHRVNEIFAQAVLEVVEPDDIIWVHDYHLMLLPRLLRERLPDNPIGFFLHIPWPTYEVYRVMPTSWRHDILHGLLGADLIGFHTPEYSQYFLRSVMRLLGFEHNMGRINLPHQIVMAETFPMGIEYRKWHDAIGVPETQRARNKLLRTVQESKLVLSIDRLDYSKGIFNRLCCYERFLEKYPEWHKHVNLMVVVIPSRIGVDKYQEMKRAIEEKVSAINGKYGHFDWTPIHYQFRSIPFHWLVALYGAAHAALITPLRDGMNLIAKEYVACRTDGTGVLILSELAGAARELTEALTINPNDREEVADAIKTALEMPQEEQIQRIAPMQERLQRYDVCFWADEFLRSLNQIKTEQERFLARHLNERERRRLLSDYRQAHHRLIFLDYDGTLVPFAPFPQAARPTPDVMQLLEQLTADDRNEIILISGRDKETMNRWFGHLRVGIVAEHGVWMRGIGASHWQTLKPVTSQWKPKIMPLLQMYADRLPGAFVEEKEFSLAWHYRRADAELAAIRAKELRDDLVSLTANIDLQIMQGNKVVEVRVSGINKGSAALHFVSRETMPFILAVGDDWTDEDMFAVLPQEAYSIRIGMMQSHARYNLKDYRDIRELLGELATLVEIQK